MLAGSPSCAKSDTRLICETALASLLRYADLLLLLWWMSYSHLEPPDSARGLSRLSSQLSVRALASLSLACCRMAGVMAGAVCG